MPMTRVQMLQAMPIFGAVDEATINWLLEGATMRPVNQGECVFREGDMDSSVYVIEAGRFTVYRHWNGKDYRLREHGPGDFFGEMALMDCKPRSATVVAETNGHLIQITATQLGELYEFRPEQYTLIVMNLGREVCRRLRDADKRLFLAELGV